jgi:hypothetical protein
MKSNTPTTIYAIGQLTEIQVAAISETQKNPHPTIRPIRLIEGKDIERLTDLLGNLEIGAFVYVTNPQFLCAAIIRAVATSSFHFGLFERDSEGLLCLYHVGNLDIKLVWKEQQKTMSA